MSSFFMFSHGLFAKTILTLLKKIYIGHSVMDKTRTNPHPKTPSDLEALYVLQNVDLTRQIAASVQTSITYHVNKPITTKEFIALLQRSTLGERRPIDDLACMQGMVENSNLLVTAWHADQLIGVSRAMTDFHYACYLSDLAVDTAYQKQGIGRQLIAITQQQLKPTCKLILIAAPAANDYYQPLGFEHNLRCWILAHGKLR